MLLFCKISDNCSLFLSNNEIVLADLMQYKKIENIINDTIPWPETILQELVNSFTVKTKQEKHL